MSNQDQDDLTALFELADEDFLEAVYTRILGRHSDIGGRIFYLSQLRSGKTRSEIILQISQSQEARTKEAKNPRLDDIATMQRRAYIPVVGRHYKVKLDKFNNVMTRSEIKPNATKSHIPTPEKRTDQQYQPIPTRDESTRINIKIATIIPFYNGSEYIERAVASAKAQTLMAHEIIVVDDGSEEGESSFCAEIAKRENIQYLKKKNGGQGDARNHGVRHATSDYICFLDQDDFYLPRHNEILAKHVSEDPTFGFVYGDLHRVDLRGNLVLLSSHSDKMHHPKTNIVDCIKQDMFVLPSASIINKNALLSVGGFDPRLMGYEDDDLFLRMFIARFKNIYIKEQVTCWTINENSTSFSPKMNRSRFIYFCKLVDLFDVPDVSYYGGYIKNAIIPRFFENSVSDALRAAILDLPTAEEFTQILASMINKVKKYIDDDELAHLRTIISLLKGDKDLLINALYFGKLGDRYNFFQTFYRNLVSEINVTQV